MVQLCECVFADKADGQDVRPSAERGGPQDVSHWPTSGAHTSAYLRIPGSSCIRIYVCDKPELYETLRKEYEGEPLCFVDVRSDADPLFAGSPIRPLPDGHAVSRISDFIIYSVESSSILPIVAEYGPSTKMGATVAGQTSVKAPEKEAFERYLPSDVDIVSVHSLHGPTVTTEGQPLVSQEMTMREPQ